MKKFFVILLILITVVWPISANADNSQNIVFTGTYSFNNEGTDADSAWLFIRYDGTLVDSTKITPEDLQWDGYYQYIHACTNDSVWGWSGWWIYFDGLVVSLPELAVIATARDSSYALHAQVDSLKDTTEDMSTRLLATGFSTFDPTSDSVLVTMAVLFARLAADSVAMNLLPGVIDSTVYDSASMRYFFELFFTSALTLAQQLDTAHTAIKAVRDTAQYLITSDGDTNQIQGAVEADLDSVLNAIADANKPNFESDGDTNTNPFDNANDKVTLVDSSAGGIHDTEVAALANATAIAALNDFDSEADLVKVKEIKANVLGDTTLQDNAIEYKADVSGLSTLTDNELRIALGDSLYNERTDSLLTMLTTVKGDVLDIAYYWGACDGCYYRLFPEGGLTNKDSAIIIDPSLGPDSLVGKIIYLHGTEPTVYDSAYFYRDEPW